MVMVTADFVGQWCRYCPEDREELVGMSEEDLKNVMTPRIAFGTSGLRAEMGPGFARMNKVTVQIAATCIAEYATGRNAIKVIIGYDHRHNSELFAIVSAKQFKLAGLEPVLFDKPIPTPLLAFAVAHHNCDYGVMVTASHNPTQDNGYKVYGAKGCQIVAPEDKEIAKMIDRFDRALDNLDIVGVEETSPEPVFDAYCAKLLADMSIYSGNNKTQNGKIIYSPVHGVGQYYIDKLIQKSNLPALSPVMSQSNPDPDFSTVKFPNPEEGWSVLRLACEQADREKARFVFANDPDVDRFCMAERNGEWRLFTGNEIAAIFTEYILSKQSDFSNTVLLSTIVSSKMIERQAKHHGIHHECTLTGFKHLGNLAWRMEREEGKRVLFAFEEAIGFMVGTTVLEKDGLSALLLAYYIVNSIDCTLEEYLQRVYTKYGPCVQFNSYYFCPNSEIPNVFKAIRERLQDSDTLTVVKDYAPSSMISLQGAGNLCITLRNSGTEPKIKFYSEMQTEDLLTLKRTVLSALEPLFCGFNLSMYSDR